MRFAAPPYMNDLLPAPSDTEGWRQTARWRAAESIFRKVCLLYGYREIRTPVMESTELFQRAVGEGTDIVSKEMFTFTDRGGRSMTLRPEGTAPVIRAYLENRLYAENPLQKLYYITHVYRYERGQKGRYREHQQTGVEVLGSQDPAIDAEVITLALEFYRRLGITQTELLLNSVGCPACRPRYRDALREYARPRLHSMSADNQRRFEVNPLRMLDSKEESDRAAMEGAPKLTDYLCEECHTHFARLQDYLCALDVRFTLNSHLVRGFDYYTKTAFEIICPALGAQNAIGGGGRYDGLVEECGGDPTPGIGFGIGTERCLIALDQLGIALPLEDEAPLVYVAALGEEAKTCAMKLLHALRRADIASEIGYDGKSLKAQMRQANRLKARYVVMLGEDEIRQESALIKDFHNDGAQETVRLSEVVNWLSEKADHRAKA
jgi:histidyl-tRNA synthetase